jgi:hypothetical protein
MSANCGSVSFFEAQEPPDTASDNQGTGRLAGPGGVTCACPSEAAEPLRASVNGPELLVPFTATASRRDWRVPARPYEFPRCDSVLAPALRAAEITGLPRAESWIPEKARTRHDTGQID